ncbi:hypothetical protein CDL12_19253 [Handroanthus impetiginosus]|uniref:NAC domain-containing protein n=1 Tax=Handroanthus impetiginosus TaxID=429701 RepID=A0A2G9GSE1_9LAMI|nr:hypothetical protein CDL12_19253 [Handroanthus impetiginosus]
MVLKQLISLVVKKGEKELWTLCRIFKRNVSYRKCILDWKSEPATKRSMTISPVDANSKTCSIDSSNQNNYNIINFSAPVITQTQTPANQHYFSSHFSSPYN